MFPSSVDVCAFELRGRGTRLDETPLREMEAMLLDVEAALVGLPPLPLVIFGHSMGGRIGFQFALHLINARSSSLAAHRLIHFFGSASRPPHCALTKKRSHLPKAEFLAELREMGGTPEEVLANPEIMSLFEPMLRADFALAENVFEKAVLPVPVTSLWGHRDSAFAQAAARQWEECTSSAYRLVDLPGGHFFITDPWCRREVQNIVSETLKQAL